MAADLPTPTTIAEGRYELLRVLGVGGTATVYRGRDRRIGLDVAVKLLDASMAAAHKGLRKRFQAEARVMGRLQHPHVVAVYDAGFEGDQPWIAMEYLSGGTLADRIHYGGPLSPRLATQVMLLVLDALAVANEAGVVHRDVKPLNVLLTPDGTPKVTDFGIAQLSEPNAPVTKPGAVMGTWAYMAPEQRKDSSTVDQRADVYSSGSTLFHLLTGREPFELHNVEGHAQQLAGVEPRLAAIVARSTRFAPNDRYGSCSEMAQALRDALPRLPRSPGDDRPLAVALQTAPGAPPRVSSGTPVPKRPTRRRPDDLWITAGTAALVAGVGGVVALAAAWEMGVWPFR